MTDKQIIIDYKNLCENYSKEVGCFGTFDGSCIKEQCFTYKLLQQLQAKEQECDRLKETFDGLFKIQYKLADNNKKIRQCLTEIKELCQKHIKAEKIVMANDILQKISECEGNDE